MCTTSFHPPLEKYYFASVRGLASNRSKRPCLAARTLLLADFAIGLPPQCRDLYQISCTRFLPVRYHQISSAIAGTAFYSRFGGHSGGAQLRGRGGRVRFSWPTKAILQGNHCCVQAHAFATITTVCTVGGDLASSRAEAK